MHIGDRLRQLRESKGLSQGDMEERTGLLRCYISRVENGHTVPSVETLERLARALELELYQIFYSGAGKPQAPKSAREFSPNVAERNLLETYRRMKPSDQKLLSDLARFATRAKA